jgi:hypothetical protein
LHGLNIAVALNAKSIEMLSAGEVENMARHELRHSGFQGSLRRSGREHILPSRFATPVIGSGRG